MDAAEILEAAAKLLDKPGAWTQGAYGRDAVGRTVPEYDDDCVCRCAVGALWAATGLGRDASTRDLQPALTLLADMVPGSSVTDWNDDPSRTQSEVVAALRDAVEHARVLA